jgi:hypothetical protein
MPTNTPPNLIPADEPLIPIDVLIATILEQMEAEGN